MTRDICPHVMIEAGPLCSVRCARPAGHEGHHAVQWNEDDERRAETWPEVWRGVGGIALLDARDFAATVGEEFAATREIRRRERARRAGR